MKGVVFVELLKMAEDAFGEDVVDDVLDKADLDNGGAFTTVGNYPCEDLVKIVTAFSAYSGLDPDTLQQKFGHWMMDFFSKNYPDFFKDKTSAFSMLEAIDGEVHVEVHKLYPDAELPTFQTQRKADDVLEMVYSSPRPLVGFCEGLIQATVEHFDENAEITRSEPDAQTGDTAFQIKHVS